MANSEKRHINLVGGSSVSSKPKKSRGKSRRKGKSGKKRTTARARYDRPGKG